MTPGGMHGETGAVTIEPQHLEATVNRKTACAQLILLATLAVGAPAALAKSIPVFMGTGTKIVYIAPLSESQRDELGPSYGPEHLIGFGYQTVALLGIDVWTWNGRYCIYADRACDEVSAARTAEVLGIAEADLPKPWTYSFPPGAIICVLLLAGWVAYASRRKRMIAARPNASDDPRYQRAMEMVMAGTKVLPLNEQGAAMRDNFPAGVEYLVENGIEREEASRVLLGLVDTVLDFRRRIAKQR